MKSRGIELSLLFGPHGTNLVARGNPFHGGMFKRPLNIFDGWESHRRIIA